METIRDFLINGDWKLKHPSLIISVTGGAELSLKPRLKETFCKNLVKAATATSKF